MPTFFVILNSLKIPKQTIKPTVDKKIVTEHENCFNKEVLS